MATPVSGKHGDRIVREHQHDVDLRLRGRAPSGAVSHLELAFASDPDHRGVRKSLGYSYVWSGNFERGLSLLAEVPEARQELGVYEWWWGVQGRADIAENAGLMAELLDAK